MPIPGYPPNTLYSEVATTDFGVHMCGSAIGCRTGLGPASHLRGRVDRAGTIHWSGAHKRASKRGMRGFLKLMALVFHREYWDEPRWKRLWLQNQYAWEEAQARYHYRIRSEWARSDAELAMELAKRDRSVHSLRWQHRSFYLWCQRRGVR